MAAKKNIILLVQKFVSDVERLGVKINEAVLFGSYAKGTPTADSDIDVALVSDKFINFEPIDLDLFMKAKIKKEYTRIHVQTYSTKYFKKGDPFVEEIKNTGIRLIKK